jgi:16S rRNA (cytidine1402-2'-O)-methyltransferase
MVVLVEAGVGAVVEGGVSVGARVREVMAADGVEEKDALKRVARERGLGKSEAYRELQRERGKR